MTKEEEKRLEPITLQVHFGDGSGFDKNALKAYKYENELKREVNNNKNRIRHYLFNKFGIAFEHEVKVSEPGEAPVIERFTITELINDKLTSVNSKTCLSTYEIFKEKGILEAVASLHLQSNLTII